MRFIVPLIFVAVFGAFATAIVGMAGYWVQFEKPEPQPIAYPHDLHAGTSFTYLSNGEEVKGLGLECTHCHQYVDKSRFATVPAMSVCKTCHENQPARTDELMKLKKYLDNNEPVIWQRLHSVPDHVYFSHKRHVKFYEGKGMAAGSGEICQKCHGNMKVVQTVKQATTLQMGYCVTCHRAEGASIDCWTCHN